MGDKQDNQQQLTNQQQITKVQEMINEFNNVFANLQACGTTVGNALKSLQEASNVMVVAFKEKDAKIQEGDKKIKELEGRVKDLEAVAGGLIKESKKK
jgi:septal ring factor EnvC (AmiA/AmiB activator)